MKQKLRWSLMIYDALVYIVSVVLILVLNPSSVQKPAIFSDVVVYAVFGLVCLITSRVFFRIYQQIWRYAGPSEYIRMLFSDAVACIAFLVLKNALPQSLSFVRTLSLFMLNLLGCILIRHLYQLIYQKRSSDTLPERIALKLLGSLTDVSISNEQFNANRIKVAIVGAGSIGVMLADELKRNSKAAYEPVCFIDIDEGKIGREIGHIPVISGNDSQLEKMRSLSVQEVVFALPNVTNDRRLELYTIYHNMGYLIKTYDYPLLNSNESGKRRIQEFNIEDLLFRSCNQFLSKETMDWYCGKKVLITGGGGSIGSELARQIARCKPERLTILDVYENGAYDIQQELRYKYGDALNLRIEIASICDRKQVDKIFREHTPDIVLHAAAHKHVPLMERNAIEAVRNNVFGTLNVVDACEKYRVKRFIMVSTDKAVNPTNIMGATKRLCEMIVQSRCDSKTSFSATRFGNVLGSNGSVIPLFKRQIAGGGPVTVTDKRIIRYFMTIPEASQLVMTSGAMANNGELYVLDMGKPVRIIDLAENMIRLSGLEPYKDIDIIETGLRPGEKLYEELLIKSEDLDKTNNAMIFVERDKPLSREDIAIKLEKLETAMQTMSNREVKRAMMEVVPTYRTPEEVNKDAILSEEMRIAAET